MRQRRFMLAVLQLIVSIPRLLVLNPRSSILLVLVVASFVMPPLQSEHSYRVHLGPFSWTRYQTSWPLTILMLVCGIVVCISSFLRSSDRSRQVKTVAEKLGLSFDAEGDERLGRILGACE